MFLEFWRNVEFVEFGALSGLFGCKVNPVLLRGCGNEQIAK